MPARLGVALGALSVYDFAFEFGLRRPDQHTSFAIVGWSSTVARTVILVLMAKWAVGELRGNLTGPVGSRSIEARTHARQ